MFEFNIYLDFKAQGYPNVFPEAKIVIIHDFLMIKPLECMKFYIYILRNQFLDPMSYP